MRTSFALRVKTFLAARPALASRALGAVGPARLERLGRGTAIRAARRAYAHVPFYRTLYEAHGFDAARMRRLTWEDFLALPATGKAETARIADRDLMDSTIPSPAADAMLARSSGTTREPVTWPMGWEEFALDCAYLQSLLREMDAHRRPTAVLLMMAVDRSELSGNAGFRAAFAIKERTRWPIEVFPVGEDPAMAVSVLRWAQREGYENLLVLTFPGTFEHLLDDLAARTAADPDAGVTWEQFRRVRILLTGQVVARSLRARIRRELGIAPLDLISEEIALGSSDSGQVVAHTTPFTLWLERYLDDQPDLYDALDFPSQEHRGKTLMEMVPPLLVYVEQDEVEGVRLTAWKHRPLIRYRSNDLVWLRPGHGILRALDRAAPGWRRDYARYGYSRGWLPRASTLGIVLGRADDIRILNATNIAPEVLSDALREAGILPSIHHFKHDTDETRPSEYTVFLELPDTRDELACLALAQEWQPRLLAAFTAQPALAYVAADPIELRLYVRSRGTEEFLGDDQRAKKSYVPRRATASVVQPASSAAPVLAPPALSEAPLASAEEKNRG